MKKWTILLMMSFLMINFSSGDISFSSAHAFRTCESELNYKKMDHLFYDWLDNQVKGQETRVALFPFRDGSAVKHTDEIALTGLQIALYEYLSKVLDYNIIHPFSVWDKLGGYNIPKNMSDRDLIKKAKEMGATHLIFGQFQKQTDNKIRYFTRLVYLENTGDHPRIKTKEYKTEASSSFFTETAGATKDISMWLGGNFINEEITSLLINTAPTYEAFRYYVKGMMVSHKYDEVQLNIAKSWFEKSFSLSYNFTEALWEKSRILQMIALIKREAGIDPASFLTEANQVMELASKIDRNVEYASYHDKTKDVFKQKSLSTIGPRRWNDSYRLFTKAYHQMEVGNHTKAFPIFKEAYKLLPESALVELYMGKILTRLSRNSEAIPYRTTAVSLNPCLKTQK